MEIEKSRSVILKKFGGYDALLIADYALPPLEGRIEVKVEYGGLNFADLYTRQGLMFEWKPPFVLGMECTGIITAVDSKETDFKVGQKVICYDFKGGMYRDVIRVPKETCYLLPESIDLELGASILVNYLTAYFSILQMGNLRKNEKVLILSCTGGVGCAATQLAKTVDGVEVFGTGSQHKHDDAIKNGVDVFLTNESFQNDIKNVCSGFDLIVTNQTGLILKFLTGLLNPLGRIVIIGANNVINNEKKISTFTMLKAVWWSTANFATEDLIVNNQVVAGLHLGTLIEKNPGMVRRVLQEIFQLLEEGKIRPKIHSKWPMSKIVDATKVLGERKNVGKVLIYMNEKVEEVK